MSPARLPRAILRPATRADVAGMQRVRHAVKENRLVSRVIADAQVVDAIERTGRGWVVEVEGEVVAFAIGNAVDGSVWALFVDPLHEGRGHGRRLHDIMVEWLYSRGSGCRPIRGRARSVSTREPGGSAAGCRTTASCASNARRTDRAAMRASWLQRGS